MHCKYLPCLQSVKTTVKTFARLLWANKHRGRFKGVEDTRWLLTSWLKMADENETAPMPDKEDVEDHGHCSDCENEEHHFDDG